MLQTILETIANTFTVFGGIFLILTIIRYKRMRREVWNPDCPEDVKGVAFNKKWGPRLLVFYSVIVGIGLIAWVVLWVRGEI